MSNPLISSASRGFFSAADAVGLLNSLLGTVKECVATNQTEVTKRQLIVSRERVLLEEIHAKREIFLTYLDRSFDERAVNFAKLFKALDEALANDTSQVGVILTQFTVLAAQSPFADLHDIEFVKEALKDPDHMWEV